MVKPASRGAVGLLSPDPTAKPLILHNYYSEDSDMAAMVAGLRAAIEVASQAPLARYTTRPYYMPDSDSDEDIRAFIRRQTFTLYHPVGTCRMGSDEGAVVDTELRVRGVEGLRVVDASVMPTVPARQHQRPDDRDRRARRGPDPRASSRPSRRRRKSA